MSLCYRKIGLTASNLGPRSLVREAEGHIYSSYFLFGYHCYILVKYLLFSHCDKYIVLFTYSFARRPREAVIDPVLEEKANEPLSPISWTRT